MSRFGSRYAKLVVALVTLNVVGLLGIRYELKRTPMPRARILSALPTRDVDQTDRFSLIFDEPLVRPASLSTPLEQIPFLIEPQPAGHWEWSAPEQLDYVLAKQLPPGRRYKIRPAADCERLLHRSLVGPVEFQFQTRALALKSCEVEQADRRGVELSFEFNQPVNPLELLEHLRITSGSGGDTLKPSIIDRDPSSRVHVRLDRPESGELEVTLANSLSGHLGELPLAETIKRSLQVRRAFLLMSTYVSTPGLDEEVSVGLRFTYRLADDTSLPKVHIEPEVADLRVSRSYNRLELTGRFECDRRYTATVSPGLVSSYGDILSEVQQTTFRIPDREPGLEFPVYRGILSPDGNLNLDLKVVNVSGVRFRARRLHSNNLVAYLRGDRMTSTGREIVSTTVPIDLPRNRPKTVTLDLKELLDQPLGVYRIEAAATNSSWADDSAVVAITNLGMTAKLERDSAMVWVTSLRTAKPVEGATVSALTHNNQLLGTAVTDADGVARVSTPQGHPDGEVWVITGEHHNDLAYLEPEKHRWVLDDVDQSGRDIPTTYDIILYTERGVYRPGDTIHLSGVIRDAFGETPPPFPISIRVKRPDGKQVAELIVKADGNAEGMFHLDIPTRDDGQTGAYHFAARLPGGSETLGETTALVEAFVPIRMEVKADPVQARFDEETRPSIRLRARYLFGQPAAKLPFNIETSYRRIAFESDEYPDFVFGSEGESARPAAKCEGELDEQGEEVCSLELPDRKKPGLWRGHFTATVTEPGGRSVSDNGQFVVDTCARHVGLRIPLGRIVPIDAPVAIEWVQVNGDDESIRPVVVHFRLTRVEYTSYVQEVNGRPVWRSRERVTPIVEDKLIPAELGHGAGTFSVRCPQAGQYRLTASVTGAEPTQIEFYAASDALAHQTLAINQPERLEIVLDENAYARGSTAQVLVRSPFKGMVWATLETDRVITHRSFEMVENTAGFELPLTTGLRGGGFLAATVVRPIDPQEKDWLPHRAVGMIRLVADHSDHRLHATLSAPTEAEPGQSIQVSVETEGFRNRDRGGIVHLWAVDKGILLTTAYETPDPYEHFLAQRAAYVDSADTFGELLPDHLRPGTMDRIGGDGDLSGKMGEALRRSPVPSKRRDPAVVWRTAVPLDEQGRASVELPMPDMTGEMQIMGVVVAGDRYGKAESSVTLTSPLLVEASWPRFVAPGDEFMVPVKVFNGTTEMLHASVTFSIEGPVELPAESRDITLDVNPGQPETVWIEARAVGVGNATVKTSATAEDDVSGKLTSDCTADVLVRPIAPLQHERRFFRIEAGESLTIGGSDFLPGTTRTTVSIGARPTVDLLPAIEQLIDYPYGCVEQTTSRLYAMLYAPELLSQEAVNETRAEFVEQLIEDGIARLRSMQTRSGGLAYWPSETRANPWGTAYAAEFLLDAVDAGYDVDSAFIDDIVTYLETELDGHDSDSLSDNLRALLCLILARRDDPPHGWMAKLSERPERLDLAGLAQLATAWAASGRKDRASAILASVSLDANVTASTGGRITSQTRQEAVALSALLGIDPDHALVPVLVRRLDPAREGGVQGNTLESASAIAALARYQMLTKCDSAFRGVCRAGGTSYEFDHEEPRTFKFGDLEDPVSISTEGTGTIFVSLTRQGLSRDEEIEPFDRRLRVRRTWFARDGSPVDIRQLRVGDLIRVETRVAAPNLPSGKHIDNVAIVDALPGGLEVENPRLETSAIETDDEEESAKADRVEFLDDRVVLFTSVSGTERVFRYALRVTSGGSFALPPIEASCMYDGDYASLHGSSRVRVIE